MIQLSDFGLAITGGNQSKENIKLGGGGGGEAAGGGGG